MLALAATVGKGGIKRKRKRKEKDLTEGAESACWRSPLRSEKAG